MKLRNKYFLLRHGEAKSNAKNIVSSWPETFKNPLTANGKQQIKAAAEKLTHKNVDFIFASDLLRTKQTAEIVAKKLKLEVKFDTRLREISFGDLNGRPAEELLYLGFEKDRVKHGLKRSEDYKDVLKRVLEFIKDIDKKHKGKTILIVSHQCPLWILQNRVEGYTLAQGLKRYPKEKRIFRGELRQLH
jgi:broad specificity phosphatase PhoE